MQIQMHDALKSESKMQMQDAFKSESKMQIQDAFKSASDSFYITIWDLKSQSKKFKLEGHTGPVLTLVKLENDELASGSYENSWTKTFSSIIIWDLKSGSMKYKLEGHKGPVTALLNLGNGELASGSGDKSIIIWDF